jgi:hypothetical protein
MIEWKKRSNLGKRVSENMHVPWSHHAPASNPHYDILPAGAASHIALVGIEPESGLTLIQEIIESATTSLWIEMYLFDNDFIAQMLLKQRAIHHSLDLRLLSHHSDLPASLDLDLTRFWRVKEERETYSRKQTFPYRYRRDIATNNQLWRYFIYTWRRMFAFYTTFLFLNHLKSGQVQSRQFHSFMKWNKWSQMAISNYRHFCIMGRLVWPQVKGKYNKR